MGSRALSRSVEDYLKAIYDLTQAGEAASTKAVAASLDIQPASVTGMVKKLAEGGLVEHVPYRGVRLTEAGEREALKVLRRHRVLETYLCERLGFSWDDVHEEAERLEHAASDTLIEKMAAALGSPRHDPHGSPIPTRAGEIESTDHATLADASPGARLKIRAVRDEEASELRSMAEEGLVPGVSLRVADRQPAMGIVGVTVGDEGTEVEVEMAIAKKIYVVPDESRP